MIVLTQDQIDVLGRPNFTCNQVAWLLIGDGIYAPLPERHKSEYEQAVCIHWLLSMQEKYGDNWRIKAGEELERIAAKAVCSQVTGG